MKSVANFSKYIRTEITRDAASVGTALKTKLCLYVQKCAYRKYLIAGNA